MAAGALGRLAVNDATAAEALAQAAARADTPNDLRESILSALKQVMIKSPKASAALNPLTDASAVFDLKTRHAAQLAQWALDRDRFDEIAERLLLDVAAEDPIAANSALRTMNAMLNAASEPLANPYKRLSIDERKAILRLFENHLRPSDRWHSDMRATVAELIQLLREDVDRTVRSRAASLHLPDPSAAAPRGFIGGDPLSSQPLP